MVTAPAESSQMCLSCGYQSTSLERICSRTCSRSSAPQSSNCRLAAAVHENDHRCSRSFICFQIHFEIHFEYATPFGTKPRFFKHKCPGAGPKRGTHGRAHQNTHGGIRKCRREWPLTCQGLQTPHTRRLPYCSVMRTELPHAW